MKLDDEGLKAIVARQNRIDGIPLLATLDEATAKVWAEIDSSEVTA